MSFSVVGNSFVNTSRYCCFRPGGDICGALFTAIRLDRSFTPSREWRMIGFPLGLVAFRAGGRLRFFIVVLLS